jgi:polar amino acid transport system substrate-binding protein
MSILKESGCPKRLACWLLAMALASPLAAQELRLARNELAAEQSIAAQILRDIYARAGLGLEVVAMPGKRARVAALDGQVDGEVARVLSYAESNPKLVRVEPGYYRLVSTVFARSGSTIRIAQRQDLHQYRVGIVRGIAHAEAAVAGMPDVVAVGTYEQMYRMLAADRIDVAIDTSTNGDC